MNDYRYKDISQETKLFVDQFIKKIEYVDESVLSLYNSLPQFLEIYSKDVISEILKYHLKKKHSKTAFSNLLCRGILTDETIKELKLTDKQLTELVFTEFKQLTKRSIRVADITRLKRFRKIKSAFTESVILTITTKFIKESEAEKVSNATMEVILTMFFHYLDMDFSDYPDSQLLLAISIDGDIEV